MNPAYLGWVEERNPAIQEIAITGFKAVRDFIFNRLLSFCSTGEKYFLFFEQFRKYQFPTSRRWRFHFLFVERWCLRIISVPLGLLPFCRKHWLYQRRYVGRRWFAQTSRFFQEVPISWASPAFAVCRPVF